MGNQSDSIARADAGRPRCRGSTGTSSVREAQPAFCTAYCEPDRLSNKLTRRELAQDVVDMRLRRAHADEELAGDLAVRRTATCHWERLLSADRHDRGARHPPLVLRPSSITLRPADTPAATASMPAVRPDACARRNATRPRRGRAARCGSRPRRAERPRRPSRRTGRCRARRG